MVVGIAEHTENVAEAEPVASRRIPVARPHRVEEWVVGERCFGAAMHGEDFLECRGKTLVEAVPIDAARSASGYPDVMREGHRRPSVTAFERDPGAPSGLSARTRSTRLEILVDYGESPCSKEWIWIPGTLVNNFLPRRRAR